MAAVVNEAGMAGRNGSVIVKGDIASLVPSDRDDGFIKGKLPTFHPPRGDDLQKGGGKELFGCGAEEPDESTEEDKTDEAATPS